MKVCSACSAVKAREGFSKKQWLQNSQRRRCKDCIASGGATPTSAPFGSAVDAAKQSMAQPNPSNGNPSHGVRETRGNDTAPTRAKDYGEDSKAELSKIAETDGQIGAIMRDFLAEINGLAPEQIPLNMIDSMFSNPNIQYGPARSTPDNTPKSCWICLEGSEESSESLRRDCACRGSAGWAHLSCLTQYAKSKSKAATDGNAVCAEALAAFVHPWAECNQCKQQYGNQLGKEIADSLCSFVDAYYAKKKYRFLLKLEAMNHKLCLVSKRADQSFDVWDDVDQIAHDMLGLVENVKMRDFHPGHYLMAEGNAYDQLATGLIYRCQRAKMYGKVDQTQKEKDLKQALKYFRKSRISYKKLSSKASKFESNVTAQDMNIDLVQSLLQGEGQLGVVDVGRLRDIYNHTVDASVGGKGESLYSIKSGIELASALMRCHETVEAERLLTKLLRMSDRVFGLDHDLSLRAHRELHKCQIRKVQIAGVDSGTSVFAVIKLKEDEETCLVCAASTVYDAQPTTRCAPQCQDSVRQRPHSTAG
ncbi:hypothetical protein THAOC_03634 [Thalassiosira oceanica]|uniref:RING-CH-type domain-containing protein n=1 Tax=Thalassiosira oceanica TaxID=159749 RepID=K0TB27_THAOC|nr:hypothetical protein THAOC_03634 [Thalassiosira oceanica]|eukprot:EJK74675.1 hypothetical protein THAOC_03634 [Thalassiosira oceanica]